MRAVARTATLAGVEAVPVDVEADVGPGLPSFTLVGLCDTAVREARERVRSAIKASGFVFPSGRVVLNLAPARLRKRGTGFDLPIAAAILAATGQIPRVDLAEASFVGELSLGGDVRPVAGLFAHAVSCRTLPQVLFGPVEGSGPAQHVAGDAYRGIAHLRELECPVEHPRRVFEAAGRPAHADLSWVQGHDAPRRALEICAAGAHNLVLEGPPGSGKSLLADCLRGILPPMSGPERHETALIHSIAGLDETEALSGTRPFRAPHHSCSTAGLLGGGRDARPGEACLAHNGVLFLDEMTEFAPSVLQSLRTPLEEGHLRLVRADATATYPASFTLVGAFNPCPCGYAGDPTRRCDCAPSALLRHQHRLGGPLMDRIDLRVRVDRIPPEQLVRARQAESSELVGQRVLLAREHAARRLGPGHARLSGQRLLETCSPTEDALVILTDAARAHALSARGVTRTLRVGRSIADLDGRAKVAGDDVLEALAFRAWDKPR